MSVPSLMMRLSEVAASNYQLDAVLAAGKRERKHSLVQNKDTNLFIFLILLILSDQ